MRTLVLVAVAALVLGFVVLRDRPAPPPPPADTPPEAASSQGGTVVTDPDAAERERARLRALRRIAESETYLGAMLADQDSMLRRWPERMTRPLRIYMPRGDRVPGWTDHYDAAVQAAFFRWERVADVPIRFTFVRDTAGAEVQVRWTPEFTGRRTGQADIVWDRGGWIVRGTLTLALRTPGGAPLSDDAVHTVALHEIGHLLGLGHSDDPADVMHATTDIKDLTLRDRNSARLLYGLEPGSLKGR